MLILFWGHLSDLREHSVKAADAAKAGSHGDFRNAAAVQLENAANLTVSDMVSDRERMEFDVTSDGYAHAVHFDLEAARRFSDQYFDLLPGQTHHVVLYNAQGVAPEEIVPTCVIPG